MPRLARDAARRRTGAGPAEGPPSEPKVNSHSCVVRHQRRLPCGRVLALCDTHHEDLLPHVSGANVCSHCRHQHVEPVLGLGHGGRAGAWGRWPRAPTGHALACDLPRPGRCSDRRCASSLGTRVWRLARRVAGPSCAAFFGRGRGPRAEPATFRHALLGQRRVGTAAHAGSGAAAGPALPPRACGFLALAARRSPGFLLGRHRLGCDRIRQRWLRPPRTVPAKAMALLNDIALLRHGIIVACSAVAFGELVGELSLVSRQPRHAGNANRAAPLLPRHTRPSPPDTHPSSPLRFCCFAQCLGPSMQPTLAPRGDLVLVDKLSPRWRPLRSGEIVTCNSPTKPSGVVCKRITAVGGDRVHVLGRRGPVEVPVGHIWLEGDNHRNSTDSRSYGAVPLSLVRGRVLGRVWPPHKWGALPGVEDDEKDLKREPDSRRAAEAQLWAPVPATPARMPVRSVEATDESDGPRA